MSRKSFIKNNISTIRTKYEGWKLLVDLQAETVRERPADWPRRVHEWLLNFI